MSHHKAAGKTKQHTSPAGKRLGVKVSGGETVKSGSILVRQRGTHFSSGKGTKLGRDHTVFAILPGIVKFTQKLGKKYITVNG
ncbi:50S ribosomal protein L27 [soil metagenome]